MGKWISVKLFILLFLYCAIVNGGTEQDLFVTEGSTVTLTCPITTNTLVIWRGMFLNEQNYTLLTDRLVVNPDLSQADKLRVVVNNVTGNYDLQIGNVSQHDEGVYKCIYTVNSVKFDHIWLYIKKLPTNLHFVSYKSGSEVTIKEGHEQTFLCVVQSGAPKESLEIVKDGNVVSYGVPGSLNYTFEAHQSDHMAEIKCIANSSLLETPMSTRLRVLVKYAPRVTIIEGSTLTITEGRQLQLTCEADCYPDLKNIMWLTDNGNTYLHERNEQLVVPRVNRSQTGDYICRVQNEVGTREARIMVTVQYPPEVIIKSVSETSKRKRFDCLPFGVPTLYTFLPWEHMSLFGEHIRFLEGYNNGTLILDTITSDSYQYDGVYVCSVTNGIPDLSGTKKQKEQITLNSTGRPIFVRDNDKVQFGTKGETTMLTFYVYSNPNITSMTLHGGTRRKTYRNEYIGMEKKVLWHICHQKRIRVNGYMVKVGTFIHGDNDFTNFTITAKNNIGEDDLQFELKSASIPEMPEDIQVTSTVKAVTVSWMRKFNGGYQQNFYVEIRKETEQTWTMHGPFQDTRNNIQSCKLKGLDSESVYLLRMFSNNTIGNSNKTESIKIKTSEHTSYGAYFGVVTFVAIVIVTTIIGVKLFQNYKKRTDRAFGDVVNGNADNAGIGPVENALYHSQNLANNNTMCSATYSTMEGRGKPKFCGHSVVSYSTADSDNEDNTGTENHSERKFMHNDDDSQRLDSPKGDQLNYSEIIFHSSSSSKFVIRGLENKTTYSEIDFTKRASPLSSSEDEDTESDNDDFVSITGIQQYVKRDVKFS